MNFLSFFERHYYLETSILKRVYICLSISIFVSFFLIVFQPFGMAYGHRLTVFEVALGSGCICFLIMLVCNVGLFYFFPRYFQKEKWTLGKELLITMFTVSIIGFFNILYASWAGFIDFSLWSVFKFEFYTLSIAFFPIFLSFSIKSYLDSRKVVNQILATQLKQESIPIYTNSIQIELPQNDILEKKKLEEDLLNTVPLNSKPILIYLPTENKEENFKVEPDNLLYIQAADNYVEIIFLENNVLSKKLIRNTLKSISEFVEKDFPQFFRCHKSYLINLHQVKHISGNAQGYKLHLNYGNESIPVSRKNNSIIKQKIENFTKNHV